MFGLHADPMRAVDQPYVRTSDAWAYGERAEWRTAEKLEDVISWTSTTYPELTTDPRK